MERDVVKIGKYFYAEMNGFERAEIEQNIWWLNQMIEDEDKKIKPKPCLVKCGMFFLYYHPDGHKNLFGD